MSILDSDLIQLKNDLLQMWALVIGQMEKARMSLKTGDKNLAREVRANEKRVDAFELKLDMDSENVLLLKNPAAVDLRFVISALKINYNLERIGDYANAMAKIAEHSGKPLSEHILQETHLPEMYLAAQTMLQESYNAFEHNDKTLVHELFNMDDKLDKLNAQAEEIITRLIKEGKEEITTLLNALSIMHKLERTGDHILNIAEELIFYLEANIVKHSKLQKKQEG